MLGGTLLPNPCSEEHITAPLQPQVGNCSHAVGVLCFAFPTALVKGCRMRHFLDAAGREQILLGASSQERVRGALKTLPSP